MEPVRVEAATRTRYGARNLGDSQCLAAHDLAGHQQKEMSTITQNPWYLYMVGLPQCWSWFVQNEAQIATATEIHNSCAAVIPCLACDHSLSQ